MVKKIDKDALKVIQRVERYVFMEVSEKMVKIIDKK